MDFDALRAAVIEQSEQLAHPRNDAERQSRDVAHAHVLFSNLKLHGEHSALKAAFNSLWPSAFSHGFQVAKEIYSAKAEQPEQDELRQAIQRIENLEVSQP